MAVRLAFVGSPASAADRQRRVAGRRRLEQASDCHESDVERGGDASSILCAVSTELIHPSIDPVLSRPVASSCAPSAPYSALLLQLAPLRARPIPQRAPTRQTRRRRAMLASVSGPLAEGGDSRHTIVPGASRASWPARPGGGDAASADAGTPDLVIRKSVDAVFGTGSSDAHQYVSPSGDRRRS